MVLIIGHPFPLRKNGSPRLLGLAKYLPQYGWESTILTGKLIEYDSRFKIIEAGGQDGIGAQKSRYSFIPEPILRLAGEFINYPDYEKNWFAPAFQAGCEFINREKPDVILSSSPPVTVNLIAQSLSVKYGIPWVADMRDLWSQNANYYYSPIRRMRDARLEHSVMSHANAIVTVTEPWQCKLQTVYHKPISVIPNGYDPDQFKGEVPLTQEFTVTYTGTVYKGKQDMNLFLNAVESLSKDGHLPKDSVHLRVYHTLSHEEAVRKQRESQVLLLLDWNDAKEDGVMPLKMFEYLATNRPILAIGGHDGNVVSKILNETKHGLHATNIEEAKVYVKAFYEYYRGLGHVPYMPILPENKYTYKEMARKFAVIMDKI
jgi:glycosyltransferase involved in cell wall biosynthesis